MIKMVERGAQLYCPDKDVSGLLGVYEKIRDTAEIAIIDDEGGEFDTTEATKVPYNIRHRVDAAGPSGTVPKPTKRRREISSLAESILVYSTTPENNMYWTRPPSHVVKGNTFWVNNRCICIPGKATWTQATVVQMHSSFMVIKADFRYWKPPTFSDDAFKNGFIYDFSEDRPLWYPSDITFKYMILEEIADEQFKQFDERGKGH
jgi:hypothetical protein